MLDIQTLALVGALLSLLVVATSVRGKMFGQPSNGGASLKGYALITVGAAMGIAAFWL